MKMPYFQGEQALRDMQHGRGDAVGRDSLVLLVAEPAPESLLWRSGKLLQAVLKLHNLAARRVKSEAKRLSGSTVATCWVAWRKGLVVKVD